MSQEISEKESAGEISIYENSEMATRKEGGSSKISLGKQGRSSSMILKDTGGDKARSRPITAEPRATLLDQQSKYARPPKFQRSLSDNFNKISTQNAKQNYMVQGKPSQSSITSETQKKLALGKLPAYLKISKDSQVSLKEFDETKKRYEAEKYKLMKHQIDVRKMFVECQKAGEKAAQTFDETLKFMVLNDDVSELLPPPEIESFLEKVEDDIRRYFDEEVRVEDSGDSTNIDLLKMRDFIVGKLADFKVAIRDLDGAQKDGKTEQVKSEKKVDELTERDELEIEALKQEITNFKKTLKLNESHADEQLKRINEQTKLLQSLRKKNEELEDQKADFDGQLKEKIDYIKNLESRVKKYSKKDSIDAQNQALQEELQQKTTENEQLRTLLEDSLKQNDVLKFNVEKLNRDFAELEAESQKFKDQQGEEEIGSVSDEHSTEPPAEKDDAASQLRALKTELEIGKSNERVMERLLNLRADLIKILMEKNNSYKNIVADLEKTIAGLKKETDSKILQRKASLEEITNLFNTLASKQLEIDRLEDRYQRLDEVKTSYEVTIGKLQEKLRKLREENKNLKQSLRS